MKVGEFKVAQSGGELGLADTTYWGRNIHLCWEGVQPREEVGDEEVRSLFSNHQLSRYYDSKHANFLPDFILSEVAEIQKEGQLPSERVEINCWGECVGHPYATIEAWHNYNEKKIGMFIQYVIRFKPEKAVLLIQGDKMIDDITWRKIERLSKHTICYQIPNFDVGNETYSMNEIKKIVDVV